MVRAASGAGLVCLVVLGLLAGGARAEPRAEPEDREATLRQARQHFLEGRKAFEQRRYPAALEEFQAGYELEPRPGFLLDMGHAARKMGDLPRARAFYQQFLAADPPEDGRRAAEQFVSEIDRKLAPKGPASASAPAASADAPEEAESSPVTEAPPSDLAARPLPRATPKRESLSAVSLVLTPVPEPRESPDEDRPSRGSWWFWAGIGAVVVAGAAAIVILSAGGSGSDTHASGSWGQIRL